MQHRLFTYGTLMFTELMDAILGKSVQGLPARLSGYARYRLKGEIYPAIIEQSAANVEGVLYGCLSRRDMDRLDRYEGDMYRRRRVIVCQKCGTKLTAWTYILKSRHRFLLDESDWDCGLFESRYLSAYLKSHFTVAMTKSE